MNSDAYGRGILGFSVFAVAAWAIHMRGHPTIAAVYFGCAAVGSILIVVWRQYTLPHRYNHGPQDPDQITRAANE